MDKCPICGLEYTDSSKWCTSCQEYQDIDSEMDDYANEQIWGDDDY